MQRTIICLRSISSHVVLSKSLLLTAKMPLASLLRSTRSLISRITSSVIMNLVSPCSVHVKTNKHNTNSHQLTKLTDVTLLLPFNPSAIICPTISVKSLLLLCITRRHTCRHPPSLCHIQIHTAHMLALPCVSPHPHMPPLTKSISFRRLKRLRFTHSR